MWHYRQIPNEELPVGAVICLNLARHELNAYWPVLAPIDIRYVIESEAEGADFSFNRLWQANCHKMTDGTYRLYIRIADFKMMLICLIHEYRHVWDFENGRNVKTTENRALMEGLATVWEGIFVDAFAMLHPKPFNLAVETTEKWRKRIGHPMNGNHKLITSRIKHKSNRTE